MTKSVRNFKKHFKTLILASSYDALTSYFVSLYFLPFVTAGLYSSMQIKFTYLRDIATIYSLERPVFRQCVWIYSALRPLMIWCECALPLSHLKEKCWHNTGHSISCYLSFWLTGDFWGGGRIWTKERHCHWWPHCPGWVLPPARLVTIVNFKP